MAVLVETEIDLKLVLSKMEKLGACRGSLTAPKGALIRTYRMEDPWDRKEGLWGIRAPGTGIPKVIMLGTLRRKGAKDFVVVYGRGPAKVYEFEGLPFKRWIVTEK